jgi:hypothetical protein
LGGASFPVGAFSEKLWFEVATRDQLFVFDVLDYVADDVGRGDALVVRV